MVATTPPSASRAPNYANLSSEQLIAMLTQRDLADAQALKAERDTLNRTPELIDLEEGEIVENILTNPPVGLAITTATVNSSTSSAVTARESHSNLGNGTLSSEPEEHLQIDNLAVAGGNEQDEDDPMSAVSDGTTTHQATDNRLLADVKGKGKEVVIDLFLEPTAPPLVLPTSTCTICFESIILSDSPYLSTINNTTTESLYGMYIGPTAENHVFCLPCLALTISHKLKNLSSIVFPLTCPGFACNVQITSEIALLVLGPDDMEKWHYRELLDQTPGLYCPNGRCAALLSKNLENASDIDTCPSCNKILCIKGESLFHEGMTCDQFQALPEAERSAEDIAVVRLGEMNGWKRCPSCKTMVELAMGCSHITCTCSHHFCYACGGAWNLATSRCNAVPPCDLWDPILLLAPQNRIQEPAPPAPPAPPALPAAPVHPVLVDLELADLQRQIQELRAEHEVRERMRAQEAEADRRRAQREDNQRRQRIVDAVEEETRRRQAQSEADRERRRIALELEEETRRRQLQSHTAKERNRLRREAEERMREAQAEREMLQAREARRATERDSNMRKLHWLGGSVQHNWMHSFTENFKEGKCGYCHAGPFKSQRDLKQHLSEVSRHIVLTCCHKFFNMPAHFEQHIKANPPVGMQNHFDRYISAKKVKDGRGA